MVILGILRSRGSMAVRVVGIKASGLCHITERKAGDVRHFYA
jgi:hypothetical protein